jgi:transcriptional regulator with XRE-family HTH domain
MAKFSHLGRYLKQKRIESDYTQMGLADTLGDMHSQFVSNWERGLCAPPSHKFQKLISVLKLNREKMAELMLEDSRIMIEEKIYLKARSNRKAVVRKSL